MIFKFTYLRKEKLSSQRILPRSLQYNKEVIEMPEAI